MINFYPLWSAATLYLYNIAASTTLLHKDYGKTLKCTNLVPNIIIPIFFLDDEPLFHLVKLRLARHMKYISHAFLLFLDSSWRMILNNTVFYFSLWYLGFSCQAWERVIIFFHTTVVFSVFRETEFVHSYLVLRRLEESHTSWIFTLDDTANGMEVSQVNYLLTISIFQVATL